MILLGLPLLIALAALLAGGVWFLRERGEPWWLVGVLCLVAAPLVPHRTVGLGFGWDDLLPVVGGLLLLPLFGRCRVPRTRVLLLLSCSAAVLCYAYLGSAVVNAGSAGDLATFLLRGVARLVLLFGTFYLLLCVPDRGRLAWLVSRGVAAVGTIEAVVGVIAYAVPLPGGFGLEPTRANTVLHESVPGRVNGTLELSPDFLGAVFVLTIPITLALALDAAHRRQRLLWGAAALVQLLALLLTFVRASLGLVLVVLVVLVVARSSYLVLAGVAAVIAVVLVTTPTLDRLGSDQSDRYALWWAGARVTADFPVAGVGPGEMKPSTARDPERFRDTPFGPSTSNAHNTVLLAGAEAGILGAAGAVGLNVGVALSAGALLRRSWRRRRTDLLPVAAALASLAMLVQGMVNNLLTVTVTSGLFALVLAGLVLNGEEPDPVAAPGGAHDARTAARAQTARTGQTARAATPAEAAEEPAWVSAAAGR